ncbi:hypothetical protein C359_01890 [Cryptococcus neoformans Bt120]|nr:hypothetical protein C360_03149 [Cryptococcus neoformans var. grubii Bt15]OXG43062.1 hypothetical protein C359_01890 [Cryptococcus neoformans var. grubii Bt120]
MPRTPFSIPYDLWETPDKYLKLPHLVDCTLSQLSDPTSAARCGYLYERRDPIINYKKLNLFQKILNDFASTWYITDIIYDDKLRISRMELIKAWACLGNTGLFFQGLLATLLDSDNKIVVSLPDRMELRSEAATVLIELTGCFCKFLHLEFGTRSFITKSYSNTVVIFHAMYYIFLWERRGYSPKKWAPLEEHYDVHDLLVSNTKPYFVKYPLKDDDLVISPLFIVIARYVLDRHEKGYDAKWWKLYRTIRPPSVYNRLLHLPRYVPINDEDIRVRIDRGDGLIDIERENERLEEPAVRSPNYQTNSSIEASALDTPPGTPELESELAPLILTTTSCHLITNPVSSSFSSSPQLFKGSVLRRRRGLKL